MKVLVTGSSGYVGTIVTRHLSGHHDVLRADLVPGQAPHCHSCDLGDAAAVENLARELSPDVVIHAAGNKNMDFCEKNPDTAFRINCETIKNVARAFGTHCRIIYISTDYVFAGNRGGYDESDQPDSNIIYGRSKFCGETEGKALAGERFTTLRLSALYNLEAAFPRFLLEQLSSGKPVDCYADTHYSPTYYRDFLATLDRLMLAPKVPVPLLHVCGEVTTRYEFARHLARAFGFDLELIRKASITDSSAAGNAGYLFPDLSMTNRRLQDLLLIRPTPITEALRQLREESVHG